MEQLILKITVRNQTWVKDDRVKHLDEAGEIAKAVSHGQQQHIFEAMAADAVNRGHRGIGTWLAARVTKELLGGDYSLTHDPVPGDDETVMVSATVSIPLSRIRAKSANAAESYRPLENEER